VLRRPAVLVLIAFVATVAGCTKPRGPRDSVVLIIRHAEKPASGRGLSPLGERRAREYVRFFREFTVDSKPLHLSAIYAAADSEESERSRLTVAPLSRALNLPVNARFKNKQHDKLASELRARQQGKTVLVCWHRGEMANFLGELGADADSLLPGGDWPDDAFDWVIQLTYDGEGRIIPAGTRRISEHLLPGDPR
jgi:broad specificity phosphatase PhoE